MTLVLRVKVDDSPTFRHGIVAFINYMLIYAQFLKSDGF
ncbi:hypothetical protein HHE02_09390 [Helicobacter heilmannii]|nr:hypothetical protein HHE02_09390 [Helicobacter heilmannii]CRF50031.1 hypothetical protein HHE03_17260 [Helicobacter heilmannii]